MRVAPAIVLTDEQKAELTRLSRSGRTSVRLARRAHIVLLSAQGLQNKDIAEQLGIGRVQVARWRALPTRSKAASSHLTRTFRPPASACPCACRHPPALAGDGG